MTKYFCNCCGKEIEKKDLVKMTVYTYAPLPRGSTGVEMHRDCVDQAFGAGFIEELLAEDKKYRDRIEANKQRRLAMRQKEAGQNGET